MKVLLVNSPAKTQPVVRDMAGGLGFDGGEAMVLPPLDLGYMAATLLIKGHAAKIIDPDVEGYQSNDIYQLIKEYQPNVIIATLSLPTLYSDCTFLKDLRKYSSARVMAKIGIAYQPILKEILEKSSADLCIYGECDTTIGEIITEEKKEGTAYLKDGELTIEENSIITNLNELPMPARHLLPNERYRYILLGDKVTTMQTSRGCPFPCSYYCPYPLVQGRKWRARSPEHVIREIEDIVNNHQIKKILFRDATFTLDKSRVEHICDLILQKNLNVQWWCEARVDSLDSRLMQKMRQAGCLGMNIGVETGDPEVMETQAKIGMTLEKLKTIRRTAQEVGLRLHFLLIIGFPKETKRSLYETYRLTCDLKPESIGVCIITPYPGTPLYAEAKEKRWIETEDWTRFGGHFPIMHTDNLSTEELFFANHMLTKGFRFSKYPGLINKVKGKALDLRFRNWAQN